jgi:hypothetical protein
MGPMWTEVEFIWHKNSPDLPQTLMKSLLLFTCHHLPPRISLAWHCTPPLFHFHHCTAEHFFDLFLTATGNILRLAAHISGPLDPNIQFGDVEQLRGGGSLFVLPQVHPYSRNRGFHHGNPITVINLLNVINVSGGHCCCHDGTQFLSPFPKCSLDTSLPGVILVARAEVVLVARGPPGRTKVVFLFAQLPPADWSAGTA